MPPTERSYCVTCDGPMVLRWDSAGWCFWCATCGEHTELRATAQEAAADAVWVPVPVVLPVPKQEVT